MDSVPGARLVACLVLMMFGLQALAAVQPDPASYPVKVHVSASQYGHDATSQILTVVIAGRHFQLSGPTSSAKVYVQGNGLIDPRDYPAELSVEKHKTSFESVLAYELPLPDGTVRTFDVIFQSE